MRGNETIALFFVEVTEPHSNSYAHVYAASESSKRFFNLLSAFHLPLTFKILAYLFLFLVLYLQVIFSIQSNQCARTRPTPHHWVAHAHARHHG